MQVISLLINLTFYKCGILEFNRYIIFYIWVILLFKVCRASDVFFPVIFIINNISKQSYRGMLKLQVQPSLSYLRSYKGHCICWMVCLFQ